MRNSCRKEESQFYGKSMGYCVQDPSRTIDRQSMTNLGIMKNSYRTNSSNRIDLGVFINERAVASEAGELFLNLCDRCCKDAGIVLQALC